MYYCRVLYLLDWSSDRRIVRACCVPRCPAHTNALLTPSARVPHHSKLPAPRGDLRHARDSSTYVSQVLTFEFTGDRVSMGGIRNAGCRIDLARMRLRCLDCLVSEFVLGNMWKGWHFLTDHEYVRLVHPIDKETETCPARAA